ncbi:MAG TPA: hypothetical protein VFH44_03525 [Solirubrobacterales bacterium]|nr:hypothetical protein [Solirubrobacterales bacterium]
MEATSPPPAPAPPPAERSNQISVGQVLSDAFATYSSNLGVLIAVSLGIAIVFGLIVGLLNDAGGFFMQLLAWIVQLIGTAIYTGFVVRLVQDVRDGRRDSTVGDLFSAAAPAIGALIIFGILSGIAIGIGFLLLIVPGLILMTIWAVGAPAIVVEGAGPIDAFGRSYELVRGQAWTVFGVLVCVFLIMIVAYLVAALIGAAIGGLAGAIIVGIIVLALFMPVSALVASVLYFELAGGTASPAAPATTV